MPIEIITTVEDRSGTKGSTSVKVLDTATLAQLNAFAPLWATALNNVILGKITSVFANLIGSTFGITGNTGTVDADVEHVGKFQFRTATGNRVNINIPALDENAIAAYSSDTLDEAAPEVAAFIAAMETGVTVTGGTISPCDIGEQSIVDTLFAREAFRNSGARK